MIFTSNFQIAGHLPQAVAISRGLIRGWRGRAYRPLAPPWALVKITDRVEFMPPLPGPGAGKAGYQASGSRFGR